MSDSIQDIRDKYIIELEKSDGMLRKSDNFSNDLFNLDLTVYSDNYTFDSIIYNAFAKSNIDDSISLHPEQLKMIEHIENNCASVISAPMSCGKTFCIFEYIVKHYPKNIVLIVPTLALIDEYFKKIINKYKDKFSDYKIHTSIDENRVYDFSNKNIFILTHDRIVQENNYSRLENIDFLVIDEVYKLKTNMEDDRVLVLNMAYLYLAKIAKKYVLLAPFISGIKNLSDLGKSPKFFNTNYSPVVNQVEICPIYDENDRFAECDRLITEVLNEEDKTLIYFPTVTGLYKYIKDVISTKRKWSSHPPKVQAFINWAKNEIHEKWCLITALERGYLIHNGQIPIGTRMFQLDCYGDDTWYNKMLCTSTLLEGVNTTAKNIIITKPSRKSNIRGESFSAFDFYNLVGRTGRLLQHYIGNAYYIKSPYDNNFEKSDAISEIQLEINDDSLDIDIQTDKANDNIEYNDFLNKLNITHNTYKDNIGANPRFKTVKDIYDRYVEKREILCECLNEYITNSKKGRYYLVKYLAGITDNKYLAEEIFIINQLLNKNRLKIKQIVNDTLKFFSDKDLDVDSLVFKTISFKSSYIENTFYSRVKVVKFFLLCDQIDTNLINIIDDKILNPIEYLYYANSKNKKLLLDLGVFDKDINNLIRIIGDDFDDAFELKRRLHTHINRINNSNNISYLSKYVILELI